MSRRYEIIWNKIKELDCGESLKVRVHVSHKRTLIQAVRKEKSREVAMKKKIGMKHEGDLEVSSTLADDSDVHEIVSFSLKASWKWI